MDLHFQQNWPEGNLHEREKGQVSILGLLVVVAVVVVVVVVVAAPVVGAGDDVRHDHEEAEADDEAEGADDEEREVEAAEGVQERAQSRTCDVDNGCAGTNLTKKLKLLCIFPQMSALLLMG